MASSEEIIALADKVQALGPVQRENLKLYVPQMTEEEKISIFELLNRLAQMQKDEVEIIKKMNAKYEQFKINESKLSRKQDEEKSRQEESKDAETLISNL